MSAGKNENRNSRVKASRVLRAGHPREDRSVPSSSAATAVQPQHQHIHWNHVAQHWQHWEPPLRPAVTDIREMERCIARWCARANPSRFRAVQWGVTPEITALAWPEGTDLLAVDRSGEMIEFVWPGDVDGRRRAVCANWLEYPGTAPEYDLVIGDGVFTLLDFPRGYRALARQAQRILNHQGLLITRLFVQPVQSETVETVVADFRAGRIGNFHVFKFRLAMALQPDVAAGVRLAEIYAAWHAVASDIDIDELTARPGWSRGALSTIEHYRGENSRLSFPTLMEFESTITDFFERVDCRFPAYEMGERCPIVCYRRR